MSDDNDQDEYLLHEEIEGEAAEEGGAELADGEEDGDAASGDDAPEISRKIRRRRRRTRPRYHPRGGRVNPLRGPGTREDPRRPLPSA
jgi:hypothetical protein